MSRSSPTDTENIALPVALSTEWNELKKAFGYDSNSTFVTHVCNLLRNQIKQEDIDAGTTAENTAGVKVRLHAGDIIEESISIVGGTENKNSDRSPVQSNHMVKAATAESENCENEVDKSEKKNKSHLISDQTKQKKETDVGSEKRKQKNKTVLVSDARKPKKKAEVISNESCKEADSPKNQISNSQKYVRSRRHNVTVNYKRMSEGKIFSSKEVSRQADYCADGDITVKEEVCDDSNGNDVDNRAHCRTCSLCEPRRLFKTPKSFRAHFQLFHKVIACDVCDEAFSGSKAFIEHRYKHSVGLYGDNGVENVSSMVSIPTCRQCGEKFKSSQHLFVHKAKTHTSVCVCDVCGKQCNNRLQLTYHAKAAHGPKRRKIKTNQLKKENSDGSLCKECGVVCKNRNQLSKHKARFHTDALTCDKCGKVCNNKLHFYYHNRAVHMTAKGDTMLVKSAGSICSKCGKLFSTVTYANRHIAKCDGSRGPKPATCDKCGVICKDSRVLYAHKARSHTDPVTCNLCGKVYNNKLRFLHHRSTVHLNKTQKKKQNSDLTFECSDCGKVFHSYNGRKIHMETYHRGIRYQCDYATGCGKIYTTKTCLLMHIKKCHDINTEQLGSPGTYVCPTCGQKFQFRFELTRHMYMHKSEPKRQCSYCNKVFSSTQVMKCHENIIHRKIRNYECNLCSRTYGSLRHLNRHCKKYHHLHQ